ncbi:MAG: PBECR4 domain-containing protein [Clostridium sp.]|uniref:PBECR4 domain-containing protein n=1 Tax=Clostridium sp. TaxID=1506 RepID=UPI003F3F3B0A
MEQITFKERVKNIAIKEAYNYKKVFIDYEYLVCSSAFRKKDYYIINAKEENYMHLIGVSSDLSPIEFFDKCYKGILEENQIDFIKHSQSEKSVIGSVRRKIKVLPNIMDMFNKNNYISVQETFRKNKIICNFATSDNKCTFGFINTSKSYPKTLIKGNELDMQKSGVVELVLRKKATDSKFAEILIGDRSRVLKYYEKIREEIDCNTLEMDSRLENMSCCIKRNNS